MNVADANVVPRTQGVETHYLRTRAGRFAWSRENGKVKCLCAVCTGDRVSWDCSNQMELPFERV